MCCVDDGEADGLAAIEPLAKRVKTESSAANGVSSNSPEGMAMAKEPSSSGGNDLEERPEARAINPDEYVRVIPVSRKPQGEQEVGWHPVQLSRIDKASQMEVSECRRRVTSRKGYRMVRNGTCCARTWWCHKTNFFPLRMFVLLRRTHAQSSVSFGVYGLS